MCQCTRMELYLCEFHAEQQTGHIVSMWQNISSLVWQDVLISFFIIAHETIIWASNVCNTFFVSNVRRSLIHRYLDIFKYISSLTIFSLHESKAILELCLWCCVHFQYQDFLFIMTQHVEMQHIYLLFKLQLGFASMKFIACS